MIIDFSTYRTYFSNLADYHVDINGFVYGGDDRIISGTREDVEYPALWLEPFYVNINDNGYENRAQVFNCAFVILANAEVGDFNSQNTIQDDLYTIALQVLSRIKKDMESVSTTTVKLMMETVRIDPISTLFVDNDWGWRIEFQILGDTDPLCYSAAKWTS